MEEVSKWKQSKQITGVSLSSLVDFKATIAQEKQEILSGRPNLIRNTEEAPKNKGVHLRAQKDKVEKDLQEYRQKKLQFLTKRGDLKGERHFAGVDLRSGELKKDDSINLGEGDRNKGGDLNKDERNFLNDDVTKDNTNLGGSSQWRDERNFARDLNNDHRKFGAGAAGGQWKENTNVGESGHRDTNLGGADKLRGEGNIGGDISKGQRNAGATGVHHDGHRDTNLGGADKWRDEGYIGGDLSKDQRHVGAGNFGATGAHHDNNLGGADKWRDDRNLGGDLRKDQGNFGAGNYDHRHVGAKGGHRDTNLGGADNWGYEGYVGGDLSKDQRNFGGDMNKDQWKGETNLGGHRDTYLGGSGQRRDERKFGSDLNKDQRHLGAGVGQKKGDTNPDRRRDITNIGETGQWRDDRNLGGDLR